MKCNSSLSCLTFLMFFPLTAFAQSKAVVAVVEDGGIGEASARTARRLVITSLQSHKIDIIDRHEFDRIVPLDDALIDATKQAGADKMYVLRISPLGSKLIVELQELTTTQEVVAVRTITANNPEELDIIIPRVVTALVEKKSVEETAKVNTVSSPEQRTWGKKPGEILLGLGIVFGGPIANSTGGIIYGFDGMFAYEMERFRLNLDLGGMFDARENEKGMFRFSFGADYLMFLEDWSPYVGASLGYLTLKTDHLDNSGVGFFPHIGMEFFRLHKVRMLVEVGCIIPFFNVKGYDYQDRAISRYVPMLYGSLTLMLRP